MALNIKDNIFIKTFDQTFNIHKEGLEATFNIDFSRWDWLAFTQEAKEFYYTHIQKPKDVIERAAKDATPPKIINIEEYVRADGKLGSFIFETKNHHSELVAFYVLSIALKSADNAPNSFKINDTYLNSSSHDYNLACYLYFQYTNASEYILNSSQQKFKNEIERFKSHANESLTEIDKIRNATDSMISETTHEYQRINLRNKRTQSRRIRRYRKIFSAVKKEAKSAKEAAHKDLKTAYETYHAQVDLKSSIVYWGEKIVEHNKTKWRWLAAVVFSIFLTFAAPAFYYASGGVSAFAASRHHSTIENNQTQAALDTSKKPEIISPSVSPDKNSEKTGNQSPSTMEKVALASGIADLTGAALIVALLSVLLRLSLRQYNTSIYLAHDAEERVTMLKTYLALSNEGKLTADGDMKLVLEALFRPSQTSGIPEASPATPIELIIKAITDKR